MAAKALIVLGLAACAAASGESYQRIWRVDGYDQVPTEYGVRVNGYNAYVDEPKFGRLGKRSTYGYTPALAYHPAGGYGYNKYAPGYSYEYRSPQGLHKREAEPSYKPALAYHPAGGYGYHKYGPGYSYEYRSPQGLHKREADASEPHHEPALAYHPAGGYGYHKYGPGYSYEYRSPQGLHKREADASEPHHEPALAYHPAGGYGYHKYGPGYSYEYRSPQGLHKRDASGSSYQSIYRTDCYGYNCQNTEYGVKVHGYDAHVYENRHGH